MLFPVKVPFPVRGLLLAKALFALLILLTATSSMAMRCSGQLVDDDDWPIEIREKCGEPDYVARYPEAVIPGLGVTRVLEHWYYNRGPQQFIRRLTFRDGRFAGVETLGYGFTDSARNQCAVETLRQGMSEFELYYRCGEPLERREWWQQIPAGTGRLHPGYSLVPIEEWLYDFGRTRFRRVVRLENGRVTAVSSTD